MIVLVDTQTLTVGGRVDQCMGVWCVGILPYLPHPNSCLQFVKGSMSNSRISQSLKLSCVLILPPLLDFTPMIEDVCF